MTQILVPSLKSTLNTSVRKLRRLPTSGKILVKIGDEVDAQQVIAYAELPGELIILKPSEVMGIEIEEALKGLKVDVGQKVNSGDKIIEVYSFFKIFKSDFSSPSNGTIEFISEKTGHIGLRLASKKIELKAYISGTVVELQGQQGVVIESNSAWIQGIFGVGSERFGQIQLLNCANRKLELSDLPEVAKNKILIGGYSPDIDCLRKVFSSGATGLIIGSIQDQVLEDLLGHPLGVAITGNENIPTTIIITEGFGDLAISAKVESLFKTLEGQQASICGATQVRAGAMRPELIVKQNILTDNQTTNLTGLAIGANVRLLRYPYFGRLGIVEQLPEKIVVIDTGAECRVAEIRLTSGELITVPRANIEAY